AFSGRGDHARRATLTPIPIIGPPVCHFEKKSFKIRTRGRSGTSGVKKGARVKCKPYNIFGKFSVAPGASWHSECNNGLQRTRPEQGRPGDPADRREDWGMRGTREIGIEWSPRFTNRGGYHAGPEPQTE